MGRRGPKLPDLNLTDAERQTLEAWARRGKTAQAIAMRARIVLVCADGVSNEVISPSLGGEVERARVDGPVRTESARGGETKSPW